MAIQSSFYTLDGATRTFPSTKHIATKSHMAVWLERIVDSVWVQENVATYELINNSCVLVQAPDTATYSQVEIRVADTPDELGTSPADITIVAGISAEVSTVAGVADEVVVVAGDSAAVVIAAGDTVAINDITTEPLRQSVLDAGSNATSAAASAVEAAASAASINPATVLHTVGYGGADPEGYTATEADAKFLAKASDLSDLGDAAAARTNLGVYSTTEADALQGLTTAWAVVDGIPATPTITVGFNVASIAKIATGHYRITFTTTQSSVNYAGFGTIESSDIISPVDRTSLFHIAASRTTTVFDILTYEEGTLTPLDAVFHIQVLGGR